MRARDHQQDSPPSLLFIALQDFPGLLIMHPRPPAQNPRPSRTGTHLPHARRANCCRQPLFQDHVMPVVSFGPCLAGGDVRAKRVV